MLGQETIDRVRSETNIVGLIGETVRLARKGRSHVGLCPFHKERTPSFNVSEERNYFHCFGCGASGDAIKFIMDIEGLSFVEAITRLAERAGIPIVETQSEPERRAQQEAKQRREEMYAALDVAAAFYQRALQEHPLRHHAHRELARRGLEPRTAGAPAKAALEAFRIGYAPWGWDGLARELQRASISPVVAESVDLLVARRAGPGYYDRFRHRLMFAILDLHGRVIGFSGRALAEPSAEECRVVGLEPPRTDAAAEPPAKYVNSRETAVYRKREAVFGLYQARPALRTEGQAVIVEGNFDVVSLHARGVTNAVAPLGTAFTLEQAKQVRRYCSNVVLLFDADGAGRRATRAAREPCREAGLDARVGVLPDGVDPDSLAQREGEPGLRRVLTAAQGLLEHLIDATLAALPVEATARAARLREVAELLQQEPDPMVRVLAGQHAERALDRLTQGDLQSRRALSALLLPRGASGVRPADTTRRVPGPRRARSGDRRSQIDREILGAFLDYPELLRSAEGRAAQACLEGDVALAVAALLRLTDAGSALTPDAVLAKLPASISPFVAARLVATVHQRLEDAFAELKGNVEKLQQLELKRQTAAAVEDAHQAAQTGDVARELELLAAHAERMRQRKALE